MFFFDEEDYPETKELNDEELIELIDSVFSDQRRRLANELVKKIYEEQQKIIDESWEERAVKKIEAQRNRFKQLLKRLTKEEIFKRARIKEKKRREIRKQVRSNAKRTIVRKNFKFEIFQNFDRRG